MESHTSKSAELLRRLISLLATYVIRSERTGPSTATFWYISDPAMITSPEALSAYHSPALGSPPYFIDYRPKLSYRQTNSNGIVILNYPDPIGAQVNPEAAFQYALGLHDAYLATRDETLRASFLHYADTFAADQSSGGQWLYRFDWHHSRAPWSSSLAQSRGMSVMLRAWLLTHKPLYRSAAISGAAPLEVPLEHGGLQALHPMANVPYYEEYPGEPTAVLNGFMATLFGLYELGCWLEPKFSELFMLGIRSLEAMLPFYRRGSWTLYDLDTRSPVANLNSPYYYRKEVGYLAVLALLSGSARLASEYAWRVQRNSVFRRWAAITLKARRKILYK